MFPSFQTLKSCSRRVRQCWLTQARGCWPLFFCTRVFYGTWQDKNGRGLTQLLVEQVSHHPPITAYIIENKSKGLTLTGHNGQKTSFSCMFFSLVLTCPKYSWAAPFWTSNSGLDHRQANWSCRSHNSRQRRKQPTRAVPYHPPKTTNRRSLVREPLYWTCGHVLYHRRRVYHDTRI